MYGISIAFLEQNEDLLIGFLPVGSEESYTFRHMHENKCEEVLFRCVDTEKDTMAGIALVTIDKGYTPVAQRFRYDV